MEKNRASAPMRCLLSVLFLSSVAFSTASKYTSPRQQDTQQQAASAPQFFRAQDKTVRIARQPEIPVVIYAARNLENDWMRDWEFDFKNVSSQRIYYLGVDVSFPNIPKDEQGREYGFYLTFGNPKLLSIDNRATANDSFLEPGETSTLKVPDTFWRGLESYITRKGYSSKSPNLVHLRISLLSYGDGTGFMGGAPFGRLNRHP